MIGMFISLFCITIAIVTKVKNPESYTGAIFQVLSTSVLLGSSVLLYHSPIFISWFLIMSLTADIFLSGIIKIDSIKFDKFKLGAFCFAIAYIFLILQVISYNSLLNFSSAIGMIFIAALVVILILLDKLQYFTEIFGFAFYGFLITILISLSFLTNKPTIIIAIICLYVLNIITAFTELSTKIKYKNLTIIPILGLYFIQLVLIIYSF